MKVIHCIKISVLLPTFLLLAISLSCTSSQQPADPSPPQKTPQTERTQPKFVPPQIVPSTRNRPAPPILGVNYVETIGTPGQGAGQFFQPGGLALDHRGALYVADSGNNRVQVIDTEGNFIAEFGARGWRTGEFDQPTDVAVNFGRAEILYVVDTGNNRVQYCNLVDRIFQVMVGGELDYADEAAKKNATIELDLPMGIGIGRNRGIYLVDSGNHRFIRFDRESTPTLIRGGFGGGMEQFRDPTDIAVDAHGNVYIVDSGNRRIQKYDFSGNRLQSWGSEQLREPSRIALDRWGYVYVTDRGARRVWIFTPEGQLVLEFHDDTLVDPAGIAISKDNRIFVTDIGGNDIKVFQVIYRREP